VTFELAVLSLLQNYEVKTFASRIKQSVFVSRILLFRKFRRMSHNIGIIGCGLIGETHAELLEQLGNPATHYADVHPERAFELAKKFGGTASTADEILHSSDIQAVYICTHHDTHTPLVIAAAENGKHIFIEKPMALTERDSRAIVSAVEKSGVICMCGFKLRFYPLAKKAMTLIKHPTLIVAHVLDKRWPDDSWANDPIKGGGNVLSQGCHAVDLVCELAGSKSVRVFAEGGNLHHPSNAITDTLSMTMAFENGTRASITIADAGDSPVTSKFSFQMMDGERSLHLHDRLMQLDYVTPTTEQLFTDALEVGFLEEDRAFLAALTSGKQPESNHRAGLRATMILLRAIESARTHQPLSLEDL